MKQTYYLLVLVMILGCTKDQSTRFDFQTFSKPKENPVLMADSTFTFVDPIKNAEVKWQKADVFNPAAIVKDSLVYLLYRCEDNPAAILGGRTSRIGLASSTDGIHFTKYPKPVLYPDSSEFMAFDYPGGCEDPRVVQTEEGLYVMAYTSWNYKVARLSIAFSKDLVNWEKQGLAFAKASNGKFSETWSKSASIITKMIGDKQVAAKIDGKYWMYWGEAFVNLAWSDNLKDWNPVLDEKGELKALISPRKGKFDSRLTECGPPAIINHEGIVLLYNGKNAENEDADPYLPKGTYSVGKVVFDVNNPEKVISRLDTCFLKPTLPHEVSGQYKSGTTFAEGLVYFKSKWFLYYGTADSFVGVAVSE
ncbi:MAG: glycoside hydrolase family 130 protein [Bacteroidales bacterium]